MVPTLIFSLGFSPGIFWLWYFYRKDRWEPEPKRYVLRTFLLGAVMAVPASLAEQPLAFSRVALAVVAAPVVEEVFKFAVVRFWVYEKREFDEPADGMVYAAAAALGFASMENPFYLWGAYHESGSASPMGSLLTLAAIRALVSVPGHVLFSSTWGYALGWAKFTVHRGVARGLVVRGLVLAILLHAVFNGLALFILPGALGLVVLMGSMWLAFHRRLYLALARSPHRAPMPVVVRVRDGSGDGPIS